MKVKLKSIEDTLLQSDNDLIEKLFFVTLGYVKLVMEEDKEKEIDPNYLLRLWDFHSKSA